MSDAFSVMKEAAIAAPFALRSTPDHFGINVNCLERFDATGIPGRAAVGTAMP